MTQPPDRRVAPSDASALAVDRPRDGLTRLIGSALSGAVVQRFWLVVVAGPDSGTRFVSSTERVVVGTHASADLVLHDETVSRFHCELVTAGARVAVRDLGSRNGTRIGATALVEAWVEHGMTLTLGRTELRFELRSDPVHVPLSAEIEFGSLVGRSPAMRRAFALLERAAASDAALLITGETGSGKEAAAESVHHASARRGGPFVVLDCGAVPADLLESELFGHVRGSFTGATATREGAFECANGGTVFLDEIGELPLDLQPRLLRVLERKQVKPVGGNAYLPVDVRVVAATHRDLRREVNDRRFRADLYYRLAVVEVRLPSLAERPEDLPLLVERLLARLGASSRPEAEALRAPAFLGVLASHGWPGNVRELRNYLERCLTLHAHGPVGPSGGEGALPDYDEPLKVARERWNRVLERRYVEEQLRRGEGKVAAGARAAGVDRMYFHRLLRRHGLR